VRFEYSSPPLMRDHPLVLAIGGLSSGGHIMQSYIFGLSGRVLNMRWSLKRGWATVIGLINLIIKLEISLSDFNYSL